MYETHLTLFSSGMGVYTGVVSWRYFLYGGIGSCKDGTHMNERRLNISEWVRGEIDVFQAQKPNFTYGT